MHIDDNEQWGSIISLYFRRIFPQNSECPRFYVFHWYQILSVSAVFYSNPLPASFTQTFLHLPSNLHIYENTGSCNIGEDKTLWIQSEKLMLVFCSVDELESKPLQLLNESAIILPCTFLHGSREGGWSNVVLKIKLLPTNMNLILWFPGNIF